jgi:hypothetical protein
MSATFAATAVPRSALFSAVNGPSLCSATWPVLIETAVLAWRITKERAALFAAQVWEKHEGLACPGLGCSILERGERKSETFRDSFVGEAPAVDVEASPQMRVLDDGRKSPAGQRQTERQCGVVQCLA